MRGEESRSSVPPPVIGNSVYGPASPSCCQSLFAQITIPELLVLPQHQLLTAEGRSARRGEGGAGYMCLSNSSLTLAAVLEAKLGAVKIAK